MSHDMAGATLMAVGSSAPELFVALIAVFRSDGAHIDIGIGTIVGSALFNILVIIGASSLVRKAVLVWQPVIRDILFYLISLIALYLVFRDGNISFFDATFLISIYIFYLYAVSKWRTLFNFQELDMIEEEEVVEGGSEKSSSISKIFLPFDIILEKLFPSDRYYFMNFLLSIGLIALLSWGLVDSAIEISRRLDVPEVIIAMTVLAVGTSIPDLMSSIIVARQGRGGMAVSNAIGSNIFDILIGLGLPWALAVMIRNQNIQAETTGFEFSLTLLFLSVVAIFLILVLQKWRLGKMAGLFLISLYLIYLLWSGYSIYS